MSCDVDAAVLRELLLDEDGHSSLFGGLPTELRSEPTAKALRFTVGPGVALFALDAKRPGRTTVTVAHEKLPDVDDVPHWKAFWSEWLDALHTVGSQA